MLQILEVVRNPRDGMESTSLTDSTASREEEERHRRLVSENENLKKQVAEVSVTWKELVDLRNKEASSGIVITRKPY